MAKYNKYFLFIIFSYFTVLAFRHFGISELVYFGGDESRHFMNGIFIRDIIADKGLVSPIKYLQWYYLKYPALSIHQYPPLFYLAEALIITVFGIEISAVQLFISLVILTSLFIWFVYITKKFNSEIALLSCLVLISTKIFLLNFSRIMLDTTALSLIVLSIYYLDKWRETGQKKHLYITFIWALLVSMVAFKAFFIWVYLLMFVIVIKTANKSFATRLFYIFSCFLLVFLLFFTFGTVAQQTGHPLLYRTMQGVNMLSYFKLKTFFSTPSTAGLFRFDLIRTFGWQIILLTLSGMAFLVIDRQWHKINNDMLYSVVFLFIFSLCITHYVPMRFNLFLLPPVALLSGYALYKLLGVISGRYFHWTLAGVVVFIICLGLFHTPRFFRGYEAAAEDMVNWNRGKHPVLFEGYHDGAFIQNVRKYDLQKEQIVFRGSKILYATAIYNHDKSKSHVTTEDDVYNILDRFCIRYIFVDNTGTDITEKEVLLRTLQDRENFRYMKTYEVVTNSPGLQSPKGDLAVYEYLLYKENYDQNLTVAVPVMQSEFALTINDLKKPFK